MTKKNDSHDLIDFMQRMARNMAEEYERLSKEESRKDSGTIGDQGEENWAELFRRWLPPYFHVVTKGRILSDTGKLSPQMDVLILRPEYPAALREVKHYLASGVIAAFECKVNLRAADFKQVFENSTKVKQLAFPWAGTPYRDLHSRIIYGLLAHTNPWRKPVEKITGKIEESVSKYIVHPKSLPDLIAVADVGYWGVSKAYKIWIKPGSQGRTRRLQLESSYLGPFLGGTNLRDGNTPIGALLTGLMRKIAWEYPALRDFVSYYVAVPMMEPSAGGSIKIWHNQMFSDATMNKLAESAVVNYIGWDEWQFSFR